MSRDLLASMLQFYKRFFSIGPKRELSLQLSIKPSSGSIGTFQ